MLRKYVHKDECKPGGSTGNRPVNYYTPIFPTDKAKDINCIFCKHRFYIGKDLKTVNSPLLLQCGHASCLTCESSKQNRVCPQCPNSTEPSSNEASGRRLPVNLYVIGLLHALNAAPLHIEDPDISFHKSLDVQARPNTDLGYCHECGMIASYNCINCNVIFCKHCFKQLHKKALQSHEAISLNKNHFQLLNNFCDTHDHNAKEYYCEDCDVEVCSHCALDSHKGHNTVKQIEKNQELLPEFFAAVSKLKETRIRTQQTLKVVYSVNILIFNNYQNIIIK